MKRYINIITDGFCDLPKEVIERVNPSIIGINVCFGGESYIGGIDIDDKTFYEKMKAPKELPKTSSLSPDRFIEAYKCEEQEILVFTLTSKLSGTYNNAVLAKNMYLEEYPKKRIEVIDTQSGSIGVALIMLKCNELIEQGKTWMKY